MPSCRHQWTAEGSEFPRQAAVCPDGDSLLSLTDDRKLTCHALCVGPETLCYDLLVCASPREDAVGWSLRPATSHKTGSAVLTFAWYPFATTSTPGFYCFLESTRDTPIALVDGNTHKVGRYLRRLYPLNRTRGEPPTPSSTTTSASLGRTALRSRRTAGPSIAGTTTPLRSLTSPAMARRVRGCIQGLHERAKTARKAGFPYFTVCG
jgi:hypothetical protein